MKKRTRAALMSLAAITLVLGAAFPAFSQRVVDIEIRTPKTPVVLPLERAGQGGVGWMVDLEITFRTLLANSGFSAFQLTGPGVHANAAPFPGTFALGKDDRLPGLIVLVSTTTGLNGSCRNVANLFNTMGIIDLVPASPKVVIKDVWIVGAPNFGTNRNTQIMAAVAGDRNGDGIFNDAPGVVDDPTPATGCTAADLRAFGLASNIATTRVFINP